MDTATAYAELREAAAEYPEVRCDQPWGHDAWKVRDKTYLFLALNDEVLSLSVKLPNGATEALVLPFTEPSRYGLGKYGWVKAEFPADMDVPFELLLEWMDESFRAVAPKKLAASVPPLQIE